MNGCAANDRRPLTSAVNGAGGRDGPRGLPDVGDHRRTTPVRVCKLLGGRRNRRRVGLVNAGMSLDAVLARQAGVISRDQALGAGLSRDSIDHRVRARRWRPLHPSVYLAAGHRLDDEVRVRAALLWAGEGAILSGRAAAWWWGLATEPPPAVVLTVPRMRRLRRRLDVDIRRRDVPRARPGRAQRAGGDGARVDRPRDRRGPRRSRRAFPRRRAPARHRFLRRRPRRVLPQCRRGGLSHRGAHARRRGRAVRVRRAAQTPCAASQLAGIGVDGLLSASMGRRSTWPSRPPASRSSCPGGRARRVLRAPTPMPGSGRR